MAVTSIVSEFASKLHALGDAVRSKAYTSASMTIEQMTAAVLSMRAGDDFDALIEGTISQLHTNASIIRDDTFTRNYALNMADMPNVEVIGKNAFYECVNLSSVSVGKSCEIGSYAFYRCNTLSDLSIHDATAIYEHAFHSCVQLPSIGYQGCSIIGSNAFYDCINLSHASFPNTTTLSQFAFYGCYDLRDAYLPMVDIVQSSAFCNCRELSDVTLTNARSVYSMAFLNCEKLSSIALPMLSSVYSYAFSNCYKLMTLDLTGVDAVPSLGNINAFTSTPLYGYSLSTGAYGNILVPSSLYNSFYNAGVWSNMRSRMVSMSAVVFGDNVSAFAEGIELANARSAALVSDNSTGSIADFIIEKESSTYTGFNVLLSGLTPLKQYMLQFTIAFPSASFLSTTTGRLGYYVKRSLYSGYDNTANWVNNIERVSEAQTLSMPFFVAESSAYLAVVLTGLSSYASAQLHISNMHINEATWEEMQ